MADNVPSSTEKTVVVTNGHVGWLWTLTIASLTLNVLILVLLLVGAIIHHHDRNHDRFADRHGHGGGYFDRHDRFGWGHPFHHFRDGGWGPRGGFGGGRFGEREGDGFRGDNERDERGPGGPPPGMTGRPDPAKMTDGILNHLSTTLSLTDDEKAKVKPIVEQQVAEIQKQMEAQRQAVQKQVEDIRAKIKPLLTPDQQKQLDAMPLPDQKPSTPDEAKQPAPKPGQ